MNTSTESTAQIIRLAEEEFKSRSLWQDALIYLWRDRLTMLAIVILVFLTLLSLFGPPLAQHFFDLDPNRTSVLDKYALPGEKDYLLGADQLGRDQFVRLMIGGRVSLSIAYAASILSITIGVALGIIAGYYGGVIDDLFVWLITTLTSIPSMFLLLIAASIWSPSPPVLIIILALLSWVETARLVRGQVFSLRERDFVMVAYSVGTPPWRIMTTHLIPNLLPIVIVNLAITSGSLILAESGLSFLGLGVQPPTSSWGNMLTNSRTYFAKGVHLVMWPGILISLSVMCFYLVGDGLRDALDPRTLRGQTVTGSGTISAKA